MKEFKTVRRKRERGEGKREKKKGRMKDKEDFCLVEKKKKRPKENRGP